jgi:cob(I)alamin adenosyltransferase
VTLNQSESGSTLLVPYLNRLSDLLFILARVLNREAGVDEPYWNPGR